MERTLVLVKPDGIQRGLVGEIMTRFERKGLKLLALKMTQLSDELLDKWYEHHKDKDFFVELKNFMKWTPVVAMVWEGQRGVEVVRRIVGVTKGFEAESGSIRGDFGLSGSQNIVHASDSVEASTKEIGLLFNDDEIFYTYESAIECLIYGNQERAKKED